MQNVLSPSESRDTNVAELLNTEVVVNQFDTFNNRNGNLMGDNDVQRHDSENNGESTSTSDNMLSKVVLEGSRSNAKSCVVIVASLHSAHENQGAVVVMSSTTLPVFHFS
ncbi:hypothetical protein Tco_0212402 [Tanacetum coccineum]